MPQPVKKPVVPPSEWKRRRFRLDLVGTFLASCIVYALYKDVGADALWVLVPSLVTLVGTYVFGAAWDDKNYMQSVVKMKDNDSDASYSVDEDYPR